MPKTTVTHNTIKLDVDLLPFSTRDKAYLKQDVKINPFLTAYPNKESVIEQAKVKKQHPVDRALLTRIINRQYTTAQIEIHDKIKSNIKALESENTFTIITAHQPSLLTGPLYYIFKILSCINTCESLNDSESEFQFVPVFISGGEDHDFEEISTINLFGKQVTWNTNQTGSVGRMTLDGIKEVLDEVIQILGERSHALPMMTEIKSFLELSKNYGQFQFQIVNLLFEKYGLIYFSSDSIEAKQALLPLFKKELESSLSLETVVPQQEKIKDNLGYDAQAYVRPINLFYLDDCIRERIEKTKEGFKVLNTDRVLSKEEILKNPEKLSPNVVLRPLTQEYLFPNVAYIGGGGELAYWIERKTQFEAFGIPYPILIRRNSAGILNSKDLQKWQQLGFSIENLFDEDHLLTNSYISKQGEEISLEDERQKIADNYKEIAVKAANINPSLKKAVFALAAKDDKQLEQLESRLRREVKQQYDNDIQRIDKLKGILLPDSNLQERNDNILTYISKYGLGLIDILKESLEPFESKFTLLILE